MHTLIAEQAGHHAVAEMMRYVDHSASPASSASMPSAGPRPSASPADGHRLTQCSATANARTTIPRV